jgi:flagellar biogenesis protein FliO
MENMIIEAGQGTQFTRPFMDQVTGFFGPFGLYGEMIGAVAIMLCVFYLIRRLS